MVVVEILCRCHSTEDDGQTLKLLLLLLLLGLPELTLDGWMTRDN